MKESKQKTNGNRSDGDGSEAIAAAISANVKRLREKAGLTQEQLADRLGWPQPRISEIECGGGKDRRLTTVQRLADALGTTVEKLMQA